MTNRLQTKRLAASRAKLPTDPVAALRALSRILGGNPASIAAFFGRDKTQRPSALARKLKSQRATARKARS